MKRFYVAVVERPIDCGAEGIVLGCTEIPLLIGRDDSRSRSVFDTVALDVAGE